MTTVNAHLFGRLLRKIEALRLSLRGAVLDMDDPVVWLGQQLDDDERWALAANQPYPYAKPPAVAPAGGVHWRWVAGEDWHTVTPDPVVDEFVADPGYSCNLATVEEWPSGHHSVPRTYANDIIEMDSAAAGHIALHDPARVLREVEAKRLLLALHRGCDARCYVVKVLALPYMDRPGYRDEWRL